MAWKDEHKIRGKLKKILAERGMTQQELEKLSGVNQATISRFDTTQRYQWAHVVAISHALNVSTEDLFEIKLVEVNKE